MEVNKEEAARCRDIGASALRSNNYTRAIKMFTKSLHLYPLPGVKVLLEQAERKLKQQEDGAGSGSARASSNGASANNTQSSTSSASSSNNNDNNSNGATNRNNSSSSSNGFPTSRSSSSNMSGQSDNVSTGADGRTYTSAQVQIVTQGKVYRTKNKGEFCIQLCSIICGTPRD